MAVTYTVTNAGAGVGPFKYAYGTFTSAAGDGNGETLSNTTHGCDHVVYVFLSLDTGAVDMQAPKFAIASGGTVTWTVQDTFGYSGRWFVLGK